MLYWYVSVSLCRRGGDGGLMLRLSSPLRPNKLMSSVEKGNCVESDHIGLVEGKHFESLIILVAILHMDNHTNNRLI